MTVVALQRTGASSPASITWDTIDWVTAIQEVRRLQLRIAKAFREGKHGKVKSLQWILTHSFYAKLLSVKRVVQNRGGKTPGVDGIIWDTPKQKIAAALSLKRRGYRTKPLKRIYIPKKQKGKLRPLSIPSMACRAQQALHLLALEPVSEMLADKNSYGFRPLRSAADAVQQCFNALAQKTSSSYVLEGDIKACFDSISHQWLLNNVPMDKGMLQKWLNAGYFENGQLYPTEVGTPQGGIISPTLLNITLSGLEAAVQKAVAKADKVHVCVYADDFIITGTTKEVLENKVKPTVEAFLKERGLSLSQEKTSIIHIGEGFDFLGMNIRKYKDKLIIKPAKSSVKRFLIDIRHFIKNNKAAKTDNLIRLLNQKIRGWANYYRNVCSKQTFTQVDHAIFIALWSWAKRRHCNKGILWIKAKYFRSIEQRNWMFHTKVKDKFGKTKYLDLIETRYIPIKRHIKFKAEATPYDPKYHDYLDIRLRSETRKPNWWLVWWDSLNSTDKNMKTGLDGLIKA